jgi:hypothetical protein
VVLTGGNIRGRRHFGGEIALLELIGGGLLEGRLG